MLAALLSLVVLAAALPRHESSSSPFHGGFGADFHLRGPVAAADGAFRDENLPRWNASGGGTFTPFRNYFKRKYPGGWLAAGPIRKGRAGCTQAAVLDSLALAIPSPAQLPWNMEIDPGHYFQYILHLYRGLQSLSGGELLHGGPPQAIAHIRCPSLPPHPCRPVQVESFYGTVPYYEGLFYAAIFRADKAWPEASSTRVESVFGVPYNATYCCGPSSRWQQLADQGLAPVSVSVTQDPSTQQVTVTDAWLNDTSGAWQGGVGMTQVQLEQALAQLPPSLVPTYFKAYTVGNEVRRGGALLCACLEGR
ncbi:unnamed protein product [Closterium sp. Naga37s-1]|nr:unnamed protein product [Closterium sp. Naga37s-1]